MLDIDTIAYPEFVPNQILTDKQLNQLHAHLEQEDRVTRLHLAGTGIVCGLRGRKAAAGGVEIDAGYGITSDGDLIDLCEKTTYAYFRNTPYADPDKDEEQNLRYAKWRGLDIVELVPAVPPGTAQPAGTTAFTDANFGPKVSGRVLVLYLEHLPVDLKSCLVTSCDNKGRNINVRVRALLVRKVDLTALQRVNDCRPAGEFPRHLMLGVLDATDGTAYRNEFSAAPLREAMQDDLRTRLAQQDRITRLRLGMGIACGLYARKGTATVEIDAGYGITSDGDVIELCEKTTYTHFRRPYADPDKEEDQQLKYVPWRGRDIVELFAATPPADATAFTAANLAATVAGRVVVLYLEREPAKVTCMVSCDSKTRVRALLVLKAGLTAPVDSRPLPAFRRIPRLLTKHALQAGSTADQIAAAFRAIVNEHVAVVGTNIRTLFDTYAPFLNLPLPAAANPLDGKLVNAAHAAQYQYDALLDFAAAYNEASAGAYALMKECCPAGAFPRHLMLGGLDPGVEPGFRNEFSPAPLRNVLYGEIDRVRDLFKRLNAMVDVNPGAAPPAVTIRPSHTPAFPLGRRARPFYFASAGIDALWRPRARWTVDGDWPWLNAPAIPTSLSTDYAESTWLRIEGGPARNANTVLGEIKAARDAANAEFDVFCSYLDAEAGAADENAARTAVKSELARPLPSWDKARDAVTNWVTTPPADLNSIASLAGDQIKQLAAIDRASAGWVAVRGRRALHCDVSALAADYLQARGELTCLGARVIAICARIRTNLSRLPDANLTAKGLEHMLDGAPFLLVDSVMASILAAPDEWDTDSDVKQKLAWTSAPVGADAAVRALTFQLLAIEAGVQRLLAAGIPKQLAAFDVEVFAARLRPVVLQLLTVYLWMQAAGVRLTASDREAKDREVSLHGSEDALLRSDLLALRGCLLTRFATIAAMYDAMRDADLSLFRNLAAIDGLEHLAGVAKGGTFVLVAESPGAPTVVADFSLEGRLPCCGEIRPPFCLPLVATPDARVIRIPRKGDAVLDIDVDINVLANDYDLNRWPATAKLDLVSPASDRGAKLRPGDKGIVTYQLDSKLATPGLVDRFSYRLRVDGECAGESIGDVIVILAIDPVMTGRIAGEVLVLDTGASGEGATVTLVETNATATARTKGRFEFESLPPRQYSLQAVRGALRSDVVTTQVEVDGTATPTLMLKATVTVGTIIIKARDASGPVMSGVSITSTNTTTGAVQTATTAADGAALLPNLPAGTYNVRAALGGFVAAPLPVIVLAAGATELRDIVLRQVRPVIPDVVITNLSTMGRIGTLDAAKRVRKTMTDRYGKWNVALSNASDDPAVLGSDPYAKAVTFVTETLTDPQTNDAAVATTYRDTSSVLAEAAKGAAGDAKGGYQKALMAVTAAYLDRVAASSPATVTPDAERQTKLAAAALKKAGVTADAMTAQWEGAALTDGAGIQNTDNFVRLLR